MNVGGVDPRELSALSARYQQRIAALWSAVQAVTGAAQLAACAAGVAARAAGDRRAGAG